MVLPLPQGMPPPGFPPGMPPMGPGGPPPMPMPAPPPPQPPPPPPNPIPPDPGAELASLFSAMVLALGEDAVREQLAVLPDDLIEALREQAETDPVVGEVLIDLLPQEERRPHYPYWFVQSGPPKKPTKTIILELANLDRTYYQPLVEERTRWLKRYHMDVAGFFGEFNKRKDELYKSSKIPDQVNAIVSQIGAIDPSYDVPILKLDLRDEGQKAEDFLIWCDRVALRRHRDATASHLHRDETAFLTLTGFMCWRMMLNPEDTSYPFAEALIDPNTTYPMWDGRGLSRVTRIYEATVASVIADFDDGSGKLAKKLKGEQKKRSGDANADGTTKHTDFYRHEDWGTVVVYDDRWWHAVYFDDVEIIAPVAHRYGYVPYVVQGTGIGNPVQMTTTGDGGWAEPDSVHGPTGVTSSNRPDIRRQHVSPIHFWEPGQRQFEAVIGKLQSIWAHIDEPAYMLYQDEFAQSDGVPAIGTNPNDVTPLKKDHEVLEAMMAQINPNVFGPLLQVMASDNSTNMMSGGSMAVNPGANASGNAIEGLADTGRDIHLAPLLQAKESFHEAIASMRLRMWRDWGHLFQQEEDGDYGVLTIPYQGGARRRDGLPPAFDLTPELLDRVGVDVEAHLTSVQMRNLGPLGSAVNMWTSAGMMSRREGISMRGNPDPDAVMEEIDYEETLRDPEIMKAKRYAILRKRDPEAAEIYRQLIMGSGQPAAPGGGPPQQPSMPGPNTSGVNLQALGMGQQGPTGRPPGMGGDVPPGMPSMGGI